MYYGVIYSIAHGHMYSTISLYIMQVQDRNTSTPWLFPSPYAMEILEKPDDCIQHINQLSQEFSSTREIEGGADEEVYHMLVTRRSGAVSVSTRLIQNL